MKADNEDFKEYQNKLLKRYSKKNFSIKNSWGSKYIYRSVPKKHILKSVDENTFLDIIRQVNLSLADELAKGTLIKLPHLGEFYITSNAAYYKIEDNKVKTNRRINWLATHRLWYEDKEAEKDKILVRFTTNNRYHIVWERGAFNNCYFFRFSPTRALKIKLKQNIEDNISIITYKSYGE